MELVAPRNVILRALTSAAAVAPDKPSNPILAHTLIRADARGIVTLTAQQEAPLTYTTEISAEVKRAGVALIPSRHVASVVKELPAGDVTLALARNGTLSVTSGKRGVKGVGTADPDTYPSVLRAEGTSIKLPVTALRTLIRRVLHAASTNESAQPHLCSVHLAATPDTITAVSMDGTTLARAEIAVQGLTPWARQGGICTIPRKTVETLLRQMPEVLPVTLTIDAARPIATFAWDVDGGREVYTTKLIDIPYPDWQRVFRDDDTQTETRVTREDLLSAARFALLTSEAVQLLVIDAGISVVTESDDKGKSSEMIDATTVARVEGAVPPDVYGTNGRKLVAMLDALDAEEVTLGMNHSTSPIVVTGVGDETKAVMVSAAMRMG